ncbi:SDR family NAD(P)-dependent oxidoreductase [Bradyrhizobium sp. USDA 4473]
MKDIEAAGGTALSVDVADAASVVAAIDRIIAERGRIDVLINNAGYGQFGALEDVPIEVGRRQMEVNLIGAAHVTQLVLPHMRARKFGKIINISSTGGKVASPLGGWYHASKFALEGYSDSLRNEVRPFGVDVIVIEPGGIETEWGASLRMRRNASLARERMPTRRSKCGVSRPGWARCLPRASSAT